jgi:hypothetical protein
MADVKVNGKTRNRLCRLHKKKLLKKAESSRNNKDFEKNILDPSSDTKFVITTTTENTKSSINENHYDDHTMFAVNITTDYIIETNKKIEVNSNDASKRARTRWFLAYTLINNPVVRL